MSIRRKKAELLAQGLKRHGIELVVFDFDRTILDKHSKGFASRDGSDLKDYRHHVSCDFIAFAAALARRGIGIAIATFADDLIAAPIRLLRGRNILGGSAFVKAVLAPHLSISEQDIVALYPPLHLFSSYPPFKRYHLRCLRLGRGLRPAQVAFFDDDAGNVRDAAKQGYVAIHVTSCGFRFNSLSLMS